MAANPFANPHRPHLNFTTLPLHRVGLETEVRGEHNHERKNRCVVSIVVLISDPLLLDFGA